MADRTPEGKFVPGHSIKSPGRPSASTEAAIAGARDVALTTLVKRITPEAWEKIVDKQVELAQKGDRYAVAWVSSYYAGIPETTQNLRVMTAQGQGVDIQPTDYRDSLPALAPIDDDDNEETSADE